MVELPAEGPEAARAAALQRIELPALALIGVGVLGILLHLAGLAGALLNLALQRGERDELLRDLVGRMPELAPAFEAGFAVGTVLSVLFYLVGIALSVVIVVGGLRLRRLRSRGLGLAAAVLAMVPCLGPCCVLGVPIGVWSLVVLSDPEVRRQFEGGPPA